MNSHSAKTDHAVLKVAIVGASGYSGEELCALLARHPSVEVAAVFSRQHEGKTLGEVMPRFSGLPISSLVFVEADPAKVAASDAGIVFLALPHGVAAEYAIALLTTRRSMPITTEGLILHPNFLKKRSMPFPSSAGRLSNHPRLSLVPGAIRQAFSFH